MTTSLYKTYNFISEKGKQKISLYKKGRVEWVLKNNKKKKWPRFGRVTKKTVAQFFDVLGKKIITIKNQKCSKWLLYILFISYPSEATSRCLHNKGFQKNVIKNPLYFANLYILLFTNRSLGNPKGNAKFARACVFTCINSILLGNLSMKL